MTTTNTTPRTAEELYDLAAEVADDLSIPEKWRGDTIQEFVIAAWQAGLKGGANPRGNQYLRGRGAMLNFIRHEAMMEELGPGECPKSAERVSLDMPVVGLDGEITPLSETIRDDETPAPDAGLLSEERDAALRRAMERLPSDQRCAAEMAWLADMTQDEVAASMGKSRQEIRSLLEAAKQRLSFMLHDYREEYSRSRF